MGSSSKLYKEFNREIRARFVLVAISIAILLIHDTITHIAGKKLEVVDPKLQISAGNFNTWCSENNM